MKYEAVIGLEVHAELKTQSKLFCSCENRFGEPPNTLTCPVCLGFPGVLPVVNQKAVECLLMVAQAVEGEIASFSKFDRKNYFYPDMPKNYQISQYDLPLCQGGRIRIEVDGEVKDVVLKRIHLEEDTGKSVHLGTIDRSLYTLEDFNRAGVPLLEIVTEPNIETPKQAKVYLENLKQLLGWLGVSDCKMEEGSLRCDANVSVRIVGETALGVKTEVKNMNSFKAVESALYYEIERQRALLEEGKIVNQETRGWDEKKLETFSMRSKEEAQDYRYFPEPDLVPLEIEKSLLQQITSNTPELPEVKCRRFIEQYKIPADTVKVLLGSRYFADFFEATLKLFPEPIQIANWMAVEINKYLNANNIELENTRLTPDNLAELLQMISREKVSGKIGKNLIEEMIKEGKSPGQLVEEKGLGQISDPVVLRDMIKKTITVSPEVVEKYRSGKDNAFAFLVGQIMKESKGRANPGMVNQIFKEELDNN